MASTATVTTATGRVIPAQYANYDPGTAAPSTSNPNLRGARRLTIDEYQYYYMKLDDTAIADPVKIAIAVVLDNDNKQLYGNYASNYVDPNLVQWVSLKPAMDQVQLQKFNGEVNQFVGFLSYTTAADILPANVLPYNLSAQEFNLASQAKAAEDAAAEKLAQQAQALKDQEQEKQMFTTLREAVDAFGLTMSDDQEKFLNAHLADYMNALETDKFSNIALDSYKSKQKVAVYNQILLQFKSGKINYETAMSQYKDALAQIDGQTLPTEEQIKSPDYIKEIIAPGQSYVHPLLRYL